MPPSEITGQDLPADQQQVRYEVATLSCRLVDLDRTTAGIRPWVEATDARGRLLGAFRAEHGRLGRLYVLRSFADDVELAEERTRARMSTAPFGAGDHLTDLSQDSYAPFPFVPPVEPGEYGAVYEIRDYHLVPGGLPATIAGWRRALPARHEVDPLTVAMYALDGPDRILQIWPFTGLDERVAVRADLNERGLWPPPGAPEQILEADSVMAWPLGFSPLR